MTVTNRRRLYTEHKYVSAQLAAFSRLVAVADFSLPEQVAEVATYLEHIVALLEGHARHEEEVIHPLLHDRGSAAYTAAHRQHETYPVLFARLNALLTRVRTANPEVAQQLGHEFFLQLQLLEGQNALHQYEEETIILPELWRLYSDAEILAKVDGPVYAAMTGDELAGMLQELFPYFNVRDKAGMLQDVLSVRPELEHELRRALALLTPSCL